MAERRTWAKKNIDDLRGLLMREPHGHAAMSGAILQPPTTPEADWGVLYIETTGFLPMCGHGTIGVATALVETGMVEVREPLTRINLDTPAGPVEARVTVRDGRAVSVSLTNVPAFVLTPAATVEVAGLGPVTYAMVYGGNFYPIVDAAQLGVRLALENKDELIGLGLRIIEAINEQQLPVHPNGSLIRGIHHAQFVEPGKEGADSRNAVLNVPGYFDRHARQVGRRALSAWLAKGAPVR
jgi:proline racemase